VKNTRIGIKSIKESLDEFKNYWKKIENGKRIEKKEALYFENTSALRSALTTKRIELLRTITEHKPKSIYELAKILKRDIKNVNDDIKLLSKLGLLELKRSKTDKERLEPVVGYDKIMIEIEMDLQV